MSRILFSLFLALIVSLPLSAQELIPYQEETPPKKVQFIGRAGINFSTISAVINNKRERENFKTGYNFGLIADIRLTNELYLQPGLELMAKGSKLRDMTTLDGYLVNLSMNAVYLQIPVLLVYKAHLPNYNNSFNVGGGAYFAYGVGGKISGPISSKIDTFGDNGLLNRADVGLAFELQFEMPKVIFNYGVELGLAKIMRKDVLDSNISINNWGLYFGAGYKF